MYMLCMCAGLMDGGEEGRKWLWNNYMYIHILSLELYHSTSRERRGVMTHGSIGGRWNDKHVDPGQHLMCISQSEAPTPLDYIRQCIIIHTVVLPTQTTGSLLYPRTCTCTVRMYMHVHVHVLYYMLVLSGNYRAIHNVTLHNLSQNESLYGRVKILCLLYTVHAV